LDLRRYISAAILIVLVAVPAYLGGHLFFVLVLGTAGIAAFEYDALVRSGGHPTQRVLGAALIALLLADTAYPGVHLVEWGLPLTVMLSLVLPMARKDLTGALTGWALTLAGALYIGLLLAQVLRLRQIEPLGLPLVALAAFVTWCNDSAAFVVGIRLGKRRLAPRISPKKSWEGLIGATVITLIAGAVGGPWLLGILWWQGLALGALIAIADPFGDFVVSLFKRQANIKDAGSLLPGHGGFLDRLDSLMFTLPLAYYFALIVVGI